MLKDTKAPFFVEWLNVMLLSGSEYNVSVWCISLATWARCWRVIEMLLCC